MSDSQRGHAPLCRTLASPAHHFYSAHQPIQQSMSHPIGAIGGQYQLAPQPVLLPGPPPGLTFNDFDSCYSSCDDISHPSLSRESSDPSKIDDDRNSSMIQYPTTDVVEFATKLGYTVEQLSQVLQNIGVGATMDDILSALVKTNPSPGASTSSESTPCTSSRTVASYSGQRTPTGSPMNYTPNNNLRSVVVDGSNVAMLHGRKEVFSCAGLRSCLNYFLERGHPEVVIIIPQYRKEQPRSNSPITDQHILQEIERHIIYTPSRNVNGRRIVCHDDRYILRTAELKDAVIVSNDEYRDLTKENSTWKKLVEERLLMFTFIEDKFMPPDDPSGRNGPRIDSFLSKVPVMSGNPLICPYARKCTYGNKCKFFHPERANGQHMSVTERLMKENQQKKSLSAVKSMQYEMFKNKHAALSRTQSLNVVKPLTENVIQLPPTPENPPQTPRHHTQLAQTNSAPWQQHQQVQRHGSSPLTPVNRQPHNNNNNHKNVYSHHENTPGTAHPGVIGSQRPKMTTTVSQTHLYAPSTAVWGHSELSVGPLNTGVDESLSEVRARVHFHLCHIFSQSDVESVMAANPEEVNAPVLCELIIRAQKEQSRK